jgi:nucleotide-binding universal stress UspA family protein
MRILLATDGSLHSKQAAAQCGELLADSESAVVKIITVNDQPVAFESADFGSEEEFVRTLERETDLRAKMILRDAERIVRFRNPQIEIQTEALNGSAKEMILRAAASWKPDMIMIGSQGHGFWSRTLLGSVSDAVARNAAHSVYIARNKNPIQSG